MSRATCDQKKLSIPVVFGIIACFAIGALPAYAQHDPGAAEIPTVYRDAYKITIKGKPDANGTFTMVFKPHGEDGVKFTVNVIKGMKAKKIAEDLAKELTLAAGDRYKVKQNDKQVIVKRKNKKVPPLAIEMTHQKFTGMSIMIGH